MNFSDLLDEDGKKLLFQKLKDVDGVGKKTMKSIRDKLSNNSKKTVDEVKFPDKKYDVIYADPPWDYGNTKNHGGDFWGIADRYYKTMSIEDIKSLPVQEISRDSSYLFLWTTSPFLETAFDVIREWGFEYSTVGFAWVKMTNDMSEVRKDGLGKYTISNAEYCLIGRKGSYFREAKDVKQIVQTPKQEHSKKPEEVRNRIERLVGADKDMIELFARDNPEGWDVWGNEV